MASAEQRVTEERERLAEAKLIAAPWRTQVDETATRLLAVENDPEAARTLDHDGSPTRRVPEWVVEQDLGLGL